MMAPVKLVKGAIASAILLMAADEAFVYSYTPARMCRLG
jgi:hypothetical protein